MAYPVAHSNSAHAPPPLQTLTHPSSAESLPPPPTNPMNQTASYMQFCPPYMMMPAYPAYPQYSYTTYLPQPTATETLLTQTQRQLSETQARLTDALSVNTQLNDHLVSLLENSARLASQVNEIIKTFFPSPIQPQHNPSLAFTPSVQPAHPPAATSQATPKSPIRSFKEKLPDFLCRAASKSSFYTVDCESFGLSKDQATTLANSLCKHFEVILKLLLGDKKYLEEIANILQGTIMKTTLNSDVQLTKEQSTALANSLRTIIIMSMPRKELDPVIEAIKKRLTPKPDSEPRAKRPRPDDAIAAAPVDNTAKETSPTPEDPMITNLEAGALILSNLLKSKQDQPRVAETSEETSPA